MFHRDRLVLQTARRAPLKRGGLGRPTGLRRSPTGERPEGLAGIVWDLARSRHDGAAELGRELCRQVLPELARLGRLGALAEIRGTEVTPLGWAGGPPWKVVLDAGPGDASDALQV
jgi:hypothetical protein